MAANQTETPDRLIMHGCLPYGSNVSPTKYILSFGSVGHILSRMEKATLCLLVTYAAKPEKQISIIDNGLSEDTSIMLRNGGINTIGKKMTVCQLYAKRTVLGRTARHEKRAWLLCRNAKDQERHTSDSHDRGSLPSVEACTEESGFLEV